MFPIESGKNYAVITGDIIDSSSLTAPERKQLAGLIRSKSDELRHWLGDDIVSPLAIFGGDSWQLLLANPSFALQAALFMRASLLAAPLSIATRMAVAVGGVDFVPASGSAVEGRIVEGRIEEADGEAFRLSGRLLNEGLGRRRTIRFVHPVAETTVHWDLIFHLVDALVQTNWTENRARAVSGALQGMSGTEIGKLWPTPISKQTVNRHLAEAGWDAIEQAIAGYWQEPGE